MEVKEKPHWKKLSISPKSKKPHWVNAFITDIVGTTKVYQCSNCGFKTAHSDYKSCPICEVKMEGIK